MGIGEYWSVDDVIAIPFPPPPIVDASSSEWRRFTTAALWMIYS